MADRLDLVDAMTRERLGGNELDRRRTEIMGRVHREPTVIAAPLNQMQRILAEVRRERRRTQHRLLYSLAPPSSSSRCCRSWRWATE